MTGAKCVIGAFVPAQKTRKPIALPDTVDAIATTGEHLVRVGLMTYLPDERITGCIKDLV